MAPSLEGCVLRPRLLSLLDVSATLTLLAAPAGFGKSTLAACWLMQDGVNHNWLSLDAGDQAGPALWLNLIACLQVHRPTFGTTALALLKEKNHQLEAVVDSLIEDLVDWRLERALPELRWVVDDLQLLEQSTQLPLLWKLLRQGAGVFRVLITSRSTAILNAIDVAFPVKVDVIDQHRLAFDDQEIRSLALQMGLQIPDAVCEQLLIKTEGWIMPIQMVMQQMRNDRSVHCWNDAWLAGQQFSLEPLIRDHFASHSVLNQTALTGLSLLPRFDRELVQHLVDNSVEADILFTDSFIIRLQEPGWLKLHDSYRAFLREKFDYLPRQQQYDMALQLAQWHGQQGSWRQALQLLQQIGSTTQLHSFILQHYQYWLRLAEHSVLDMAAGLLDQATINTDVRYCLVYLWARADQLSLEQCDVHLSRAQKQLQSGTKNADHISELCSVASYCALVKGQPQRAQQEALQALQWCDKASTPLRSRAQLTLGLLAYMSGHMGRASAALAQALVCAEEERHFYHAILALGYWMAALYQAGQFEEALRVGDQTRRWLQEHTRGEFATAFWLNLPPIDIVVARGDLENALRRLKPFLQYAEHAEPSLRSALIYHRAVQIHFYTGNVASTLEYLSRLEVLQKKLAFSWSWGWPSVDAWRRLLTADHASEQMQHWYQQRLTELQQPVHFLQVEECLLDAAVLINLGQLEQAARLASALEQSAAEQQRVIHRLQALILLGNVEWKRGDKSNQSRAAAESLAQQIGAQGMLQRQCLWSAAGSKSESEILSRREHDVLQLLACGKSDKEIASELNISLHTAKTHMKNILRKLDAKSRTEALVSAKAQGIF